MPRKLCAAYFGHLQKNDIHFYRRFVLLLCDAGMISVALRGITNERLILICAWLRQEIDERKFCVTTGSKLRPDDSRTIVRELIDGSLRER